jgi:hypothetical protein
MKYHFISPFGADTRYLLNKQTTGKPRASRLTG